MTALAIDIESGGGFMTKNPLIAIGTCLLNEDGSKEKKRFTFNFKIEDFEPDCVERFWSKNMEVLNTFKNDSKSTLQDFANYIDELDKIYPSLVIICTNPAYDIGFINHLYDKELNRLPLMNKYNGKYRFITDLNSMIYAMFPHSSTNKVDKQLLTQYGVVIPELHNHYPEDDAEYIIDIYRQIKEVLKTRSDTPTYNQYCKPLLGVVAAALFGVLVKYLWK